MEYGKSKIHTNVEFAFSNNKDQNICLQQFKILCRYQKDEPSTIESSPHKSFINHPVFRLLPLFYVAGGLYLTFAYFNGYYTVIKQMVSVQYMFNQLKQNSLHYPFPLYFFLNCASETPPIFLIFHTC